MKLGKTSKWIPKLFKDDFVWSIFPVTSKIQNIHFLILSFHITFHSWLDKSMNLFFRVQKRVEPMYLFCRVQKRVGIHGFAIRAIIFVLPKSAHRRWANAKIYKMEACMVCKKKMATKIIKGKRVYVGIFCCSISTHK